MTSATPECEQQNARLVDFAYGELQGELREALEHHLPGCARCQADLSALRSTRKVMSGLEALPAPEGGLESLLAYAAAQTAQPKVRKRPAWQRWLFAAVPTAALALIIGTVALRLDPGSLAPAATRTEAALPMTPLPLDSPAPAPVSATPAADKRQAEAAVASKDGALRAQPAVGGLVSGPRAAAQGSGMGRARAQRLAQPDVARADGFASGGGGLARDGDLRKKGDLGSSLAGASSGHVRTAIPKAAAPSDAVKRSKTASPRAEAQASSAASPPPPASPAPAESAAYNVVPQPPAAARDSKAGMSKEKAQDSAELDDAVAARSSPMGKAEGVRDDWATAERLRAEGRHREAAAAFRAFYDSDPRGPHAEEALFRAATEAQAAGRLAVAADDFELYVRAFPDSSRAPSARTRAGQLRSAHTQRRLDIAPAGEPAPAR